MAMSHNAALALTLVVGLGIGAVVGFVIGGSSDVRADSVPNATGTSRIATGQETGGVPPDLAAPEARAASSAGIDSGEILGTTAKAVARSAAARVSLDEQPRAKGAGVIRGIVTDEFGEPIPDATVMSTGIDGMGESVAGRNSTSTGRGWDGYNPLDERLTDQAKRILERRARSTTAKTNSEGQFQLEGLQLGTHPIQCFADGFTFRRTKAQTGARLTLVGRPIGVFRIAPVLPDGTTPKNAIVALVGEQDRQELYSWTPDSPNLRLPDRTARLQVLHGDVHKAYYMTYVANLKSDVRAIDLEQDGGGPHEFTLHPFDHLKINVIDRSSVAPPVEPWVKVIPMGQDDAPELRRADEGLFIAHEIALGSHEIHVGRGSGEAEVVQSIEIERGTNETEITLGEIDHSRFIIATCVDTQGRPLTDLKFRATARRENGSSSGGFRPLARPGGEYWISLDEATRNRTEELVALEIKVTSPTHGTLEREVDLETGRVRFEFAEPCRLTVQVEGAGSVPVSITLDYVGDTPNEHLFRADSIDVGPDGSTGSHLVQPGNARVKARIKGDDAWGRDPVVEQTVVLSPGEQTVTLRMPELHELVVHVPDAESGSSITVQHPKPDAVYSHAGSSELDESGRARFRNLVAGRYMLQHNAGGSATRMIVDVPTGEVTFDAMNVNGFRILMVERDSLGEEVGLRAGDVMTSVNGHAVDGQAWLERLYLELREGSCTIEYTRNGRSSSIEVPKIETGYNAWKTFGVNAIAAELD